MHSLTFLRSFRPPVVKVIPFYPLHFHFPCLALGLAGLLQFLFHCLPSSGKNEKRKKELASRTSSNNSSFLYLIGQFLSIGYCIYKGIYWDIGFLARLRLSCRAIDHLLILWSVHFHVMRLKPRRRHVNFSRNLSESNITS